MQHNRLRCLTRYREYLTRDKSVNKANIQFDAISAVLHKKFNDQIEWREKREREAERETRRYYIPEKIEPVPVPEKRVVREKHSWQKKHRIRQGWDSFSGHS